MSEISKTAGGKRAANEQAEKIPGFFFQDDPVIWRRLSRTICDISIIRTFLGKLDWYELSANPHAVPVLAENLDKVNWLMLSKNVEAIDLLTQHVDRVDWVQLSANKNGLALLKRHPEKIFWSVLCAQSTAQAVDYIRQNTDKIDWCTLSGNSMAVDLLASNPDKVDWQLLSRNQGAVSLLLDHPQNIDWDQISMNQSNCMEIYFLYRANMERINWSHLSANPSERAVDLLFENTDKIVWASFCANKNARAVKHIHDVISKSSNFFEAVEIPDCPIAMTRGLCLNICWDVLATNPAALPLLAMHLDGLSMKKVACNPNPKTYQLFFRSVQPVLKRAKTAHPCM